MRPDTSAATALARFAAAISDRDWDTLRELLADDFVATLLHTGETFDADGFVAFNRGYAGDWHYVGDEVVGEGDRAVLRARTVIGADTWHAASFGSVDRHGRLSELLEIWSEAVGEPPHRGAP